MAFVMILARVCWLPEEYLCIFLVVAGVSLQASMPLPSYSQPYSNQWLALHDCASQYTLPSYRRKMLVLEQRNLPKATQSKMSPMVDAARFIVTGQESMCSNCLAAPACQIRGKLYLQPKSDAQYENSLQQHRVILKGATSYS